MSSRVLLSLEDIVLSFGGKPLFDGLTMHINERERICLVGKNGVGKTTLMRMMTQDLELDSGRRFILPGTSIGYLAQKVKFSPDDTVKEFVLSGLPTDQQNEENAYLADMVIAPLGLDPSSLMRPLSGGQLRRAALAQALVQDPDILLLDEPTNHLDLQAIEWLEGYLGGYHGALIIVSHDRQFLANVSRKVFWVDRGKLKVCPFGYAKFEDWLEEQVGQEARELQNLQKKVQAEHGWTQGGVTGRRKRNVRRLRELGKLRDKLRSDKAAYRQRSQKISLDALETPNASKVVAEFKDVGKSFERDGHKTRILDDFNHMILKGDRLGILGKNGSGKSTFLKMLTRELEQDSGHIFRSKTLEISYFDQNRSDLDVNKTLWETLCPNGGQDVFIGRGADQTSIHVCGYLKKFLFDPAIARDKVGTLSGGQQNRLLLAKILANPGNLLILDEPTNDLDMDTLDMLQDMLADYPGTLIIVSHDRDFLDRSVTEILAFEGDAEVLNVFGGYSDYVREILGRKPKQKGEKSGKKAIKTSTPEPLDPMKKPLTYGEKLELQKTPDAIEAIQQEMENLQIKLDDTGLYERDPKGFTQLIADFDAMKKDLGESEARWLELEERQMNTQ
ncbi:MAG: ABC-F family ATP-binding cassette domain-containing protein [Rickettsiales bacterium]|nr:ABC-F family ATP-binding cassette domain-containing protein [Rickettsiales bacterium]